MRVSGWETIDLFLSAKIIDQLTVFNLYFNRNDHCNYRLSGSIFVLNFFSGGFAREKVVDSALRKLYI